MPYLNQHGPHRHHSPARWLEDRDLGGAARCIVAAWFARFERVAEPAGNSLDPEEFGVLEPYLAEAVVVDHGDDFAFSKWGGALDLLCGGDRFGHRLSTFPQPSRSQLRRVCVRAAASGSVATSRATWALDGRFWRCAILALPTDDDDFSVKRLLVALLFAPHPIFADVAVPEGSGWAPALLRDGVHTRASGGRPPAPFDRNR